MISAMSKIENPDEPASANPAVMEMCIDNPREGFSNIFDTHPPVDARVAALVKFAGGHDPGPLALPQPQAAPSGNESDENALPGASAGETTSGPWGDAQAPTG